MADKEHQNEENQAKNAQEEQQAGGNTTEAERHEPADEGTSDDDQKKEAPPAKEKSAKPLPSIGVLIFLIFEFIGFILCLAGMSLGMFDSRTDSSCIAIWGYKPKCSGSWFRHINFDDWQGSGKPCNKADSLVQGAQAFSVMCLIGGFLTVAVAFLEALRYAEFAVVACIISCINTAATLVTWSTMCAMYWSNLCGLIVYADSHRIGNGLILFITAWCLQMVGNIALIIDIYLGNAK